MDIPNMQLSPGAIVSAHAITLNETMNALVTARANAAQWELEAQHWKQKAEAAEAALAADPAGLGAVTKGD